MTTPKRQTIAQQMAQMRADNIEHIRPSIERWLQEWTTPNSDSKGTRGSLTVNEAFLSWDHWDDHIRYGDHGCVPDSAHDGLPHDYMPSRSEFSEILASLGVTKRRASKGIVLNIRPTNRFCPAYHVRPHA